ncbi:hypothetical protein APHAL10511_003117 [Amanita phalloides]|nr:hypothetical protein APHAL10511_003117 [Amanita phalloides]
MLPPQRCLIRPLHKNLCTASKTIAASLRAPGLFQRHLSSTPRPSAPYVRFDDHQPPASGATSSPWGQYGNYWNRLDRRYKAIFVVFLVSGVYYVAHLEQVPETGRWRFMNTSPEAEAKFGEAARAQIRRELHGDILPHHHPTSRRVRRVVQRILTSNDLGSVKGVGSVSQLVGLRTSGGFGEDIWGPDAESPSSSSTSIGPEKDWDVIVVNNPKIINAMAVPGMVVVFTGILPICGDEPGLSAVLSHEIGHIVARHSAERISSKTVTISILILLNLIGIDFGISKVMNDLMLELPNSRAQEREADYIGIKLMSRACYDPSASPQMFDRLDKEESKISKGSFDFDFLRTHPSSRSRVEYLKQILPEAYAIRASKPECGDLEEKALEFRDAGRGIRDLFV